MSFTREMASLIRPCCTAVRMCIRSAIELRSMPAEEGVRRLLGESRERRTLRSRLGGKGLCGVFVALDDEEVHDERVHLLHAELHIAEAPLPLLRRYDLLLPGRCSRRRLRVSEVSDAAR